MANSTQPEINLSANEDPSKKFVRCFALTGTICLVALAFWTSFSAVSNVALRSGVPTNQGWVWPVVLDGLGVVATMAGLSLPSDSMERLYAWVLVWCSVVLSIAGNVLYHLIPMGPMPLGVSIVVACIPPVAVLAVAHLTLHLLSHRGASSVPVPSIPAAASVPSVPEKVVRQGLAQQDRGGAPEVSASSVDGARQRYQGGGASSVPVPSIPASNQPKVATSIPVIDPGEFADWINEWRERHSQDPTRTMIAEKFKCSPSSAGRALHRFKTAESLMLA